VIRGIGASRGGEFGFFSRSVSSRIQRNRFYGNILILSYAGNVIASKVLRPPSVCANFISARGLGEMDLW